MEPEIFTAIGAVLATISMGALIKVVRVFLHHIDVKDEAFTTFLNNHMSKNTRAMTDVADSLRDLREEVRQYDHSRHVPRERVAR